MATRSKDKIKAMIAKDVSNIYNYYTEVKKSINDNLENTIEYLHTLLTQIPQSASGPLIPKTPKITRKKGVQRIETIPEDDVIAIDTTVSESGSINIKTNLKDSAEVSSLEVTQSRTKRKASERAINIIKKQQSLSINTKMRRPSVFDEEEVHLKKKHESRAKRKKSSKNSSDEESIQGPRKHSKTEESMLRTAKASIEENVDNDCTLKEEEMMETEKIKESRKSSLTHQSSRERTFPLSNKNSNIMNDTVIAPKAGILDDPSMYEDAIEKTMPIMNSTMNLNSTHVISKMMNVTVVLEPLSVTKLNETVTIKQNNKNNIQKQSQLKNSESQSQFKSPPMSKVQSQSESKSPRTSKVQSQFEFKSPELMKTRTSKRSKTQSPTTLKIQSPSKALQDRMQQLKNTMINKEFDDLITDDESSPEIKKHRPNLKKQEMRKRHKREVSSTTSSEDEVLNTPAKTVSKGVNSGMTLKEIRNTYKSNALFSPYAKESVKKRVEAFEQVSMPSPMSAVDVDAPTRLTRTKTRALAAAQAEVSENIKTAERTVAQKLARKSLAKAKKISLAKQAKELDEYKENKVQSAQKSKLQVPVKGSIIPQQKMTPLGKTKIQLPMSVSRIPQTPSNTPIQHNSRPLIATRTNVITSVESFIQPSKTVNKRNSLDKLDDKRRKLNDEDARKKRDEALRLQTEEKRRKRQEKELKNKLAREAKEKMEVAKRLKAEKEREEKMRLAQQVQEKQREEIEKKRMAQLQRAHEKEERRRQEEQQRLQRLQEQEDAERILAEQRRREQEAEKRKELDVRAQQQMNAEALRLKNQMLQAQAKYANKHQGPMNYVLDSEPDEDGSDDESKPKHEIPYWAQPHIRKGQLAMQRYVPGNAILSFFDSKKCTPDLTELFQGIDRSRLKRTSSAIWKTPPRYSMMEAE
ncbi:inner centromere protein isoform X2 [Megalopta genalis]|uniref:inner centromere protein isoform X2 n=1 Tax=Megalopta genalis TaxID=115081 RepID=UPI00144312F3|nr:inner centromere protein-like isoform X2 [Megalopta genalis]